MVYRYVVVFQNYPWYHLLQIFIYFLYVLSYSITKENTKLYQGKVKLLTTYMTVHVVG